MAMCGLVFGLGLMLQLGTALPAQTPSVEETCAVAAPGASFDVPRSWKRHRIPGLRVRLSTPPGWRTKERDAGWEWVAPGGQARLRVRRHPGTGAAELDVLRRHAEAWRLGPPVASKDCEATAADILSRLTGWEVLQIGIYRRPLGERRQSFALFLDTGKGGLVEVLLTVYWRAPDVDPPLAMVRALFASVRSTR